MIRIGQKYQLFMDAIEKSVRAVGIFLKRFKSLLKFKHNFRLLKNLLLIFEEAFLTFFSLVDEVLFLNKLFQWVIEWGNLIRLLMKESVFITRIVYGLYLILLGIFGILLGFLLGVSRHRSENEVYVFLLVLLLNILHNNGFDNVLLELLRVHSLEPRNIEEFSKVSLRVCELRNSRPSKLFLGESVEKPQIPFTLLGDPPSSIDMDFLFEESTNYKFELFRFYRNGTQKVKS